MLALWPFEATLVEIGREDLLSNFDELWFPSNDDLWILSTSAPTFVLLDHEERLLTGSLELVIAE